MPTYQQQVSANANDGSYITELDLFEIGGGTPGANTHLGFGMNHDPDDEIIHGWLRFTNVTIPPGSTIVSASIEFLNSLCGSDGTGVEMTGRIYGVDEDDHSAPTTGGQWSTDHGLHTTASVAWVFNNSETGTRTTPDIATIIQEIIDRGGWVSGNAIGIHIDDDGTVSTGDQRAQLLHDYSMGAGDAPTITIEYTTEPVVSTDFLLQVKRDDEPASEWRSDL